MTVIEPVLMLFLVIGLGFVFDKSGLLDKSVRTGLTSFVMNLGMPMFILHNMNFSFDRQMLFNSLQLLAFTFGAYLVLMSLSLLFARRSKMDHDELPAYQFGMTFSNCGFMGYPVIASLFGAEAVFYATIFNIGFEVFLWTYGVSVFKRGHTVRVSDFFTPNLVALAVGLVMFLLDLSFPPVIERSIELVGRTATPLSMIIIGVMLAEFEFRDFKASFRPYVMAGYRLVVIPAVTLGIAYLLGFRGLTLAVPVMILAMPVAANGAMLASYFGKNYLEATRLVIVSTILSLLTTPFWASLLMRLGN